MKQFAIYTALIGGYDRILQPKVIDNRFDYYLFTDDSKETQIGVWKVRHVEYSNIDKTRIARWVKTHPKKLLSDYKATLWIDANLQITSQFLYDRVVELNKTGIQFASVEHPYRRCIYDEAYNVYGLDNEQTIFDWCQYLRKVNYPRANGLYETNVLYRKNDNDIHKVDELWWNIICSYSRRDQLSLNYVLWKLPVKQELILPRGEHVDNSQHIRKNAHTKTAKQYGRRSIRETFWEHARCRCRNGMEEKAEQFQKFHYWLYGLNPVIAKILLHIWGVYATIVYGTIIKFRAYQRHKNQNNG